MELISLAPTRLTLLRLTTRQLKFQPTLVLTPRELEALAAMLEQGEGSLTPRPLKLEVLTRPPEVRMAFSPSNFRFEVVTQPPETRLAFSQRNWRFEVAAPALLAHQAREAALEAARQPLAPQPGLIQSTEPLTINDRPLKPDPMCACFGPYGEPLTLLELEPGERVWIWSAADGSVLRIDLRDPAAPDPSPNRAQLAIFQEDYAGALKLLGYDPVSAMMRAHCQARLGSPATELDKAMQSLWQEMQKAPPKIQRMLLSNWRLDLLPGDSLAAWETACQDYARPIQPRHISFPPADNQHETELDPELARQVRTFLDIAPRLDATGQWLDDTFLKPRRWSALRSGHLKLMTTAVKYKVLDQFLCGKTFLGLLLAAFWEGQTEQARRLLAGEVEDPTLRTGIQVALQALHEGVLAPQDQKLYEELRANKPGAPAPWERRLAPRASSMADNKIIAEKPALTPGDPIPLAQLALPGVRKREARPRLELDHGEAVTDLARSQTLLVTRSESKICLWDPKVKLNELEGERLLLGLSPDGHYLWTARGPQIEIWRLPSLQPEPMLDRLEPRCLSGDGNWLAGIENGKVALLDLASLTVQIMAHARPDAKLALSWDGGLLAEGGADRLQVWHAASGRVAFESPLKASCVRFRGNVLACGTEDGRVLRMDFGRGEGNFASLALSPIRCVDASPDGQFVAGGYERGVVLADLILSDVCARIDCEPVQSLQLAGPDTLWAGLATGKVRLYELDRPYY